MTGNNEPEKIPYAFRHGSAESVGSLTRRQIAYIEAIIDGRSAAPAGVDERLAGGNAFPRRATGDGGMTLRDYFAADAPISIEQAIEIEVQASLPYLTAEQRREVFETWAALRYEYADAMLKERAK